jgi:hypothetical protein
VVQILRKIFEDNNNMRVYYSRARLVAPSVPVEIILNGMHTDNEIAAILANLDGVSAIEVFAWSVAVQKAPSFTWDEIEPNVLRILGAFNQPLESSNLLLDPTQLANKEKNS